tara:strand:- start:5470 stop:7467 length:1998 start_codon:yes stop_codon:yes gene_type:complete
MVKLTHEDLANLNNQTSAVDTINANGALTEAAIENTLSRDGSTPNAMGADLDMNSYDVTNVDNLDATTATIGGFDFLDAFAGQANPRGDWETTTDYAKFDLVIESTKTYICVTANTSGTFNTDLGNGLWMLFNTPNDVLNTPELFTGDGDLTTFVLTKQPDGEQYILVFINGVKQKHDSFSLGASNRTITFTTAPPSGTNNIEVWYAAGSATGTTGATGASGPTGTVGGGIGMTWEENINDADQGAGKCWVNNATETDATVFYMDDLEALAGASINTLVDSWDDVTTSTIRGSLIISLNSDVTKFHQYDITGAVTSASTYSKIAVTSTVSSGAGNIPDGSAVTVHFSRTGDAGSGLASVVADTTPQLGGFLDSNNKFISNDQGANIASVAGDTNIWVNFDGNTVHITGTNAITDFGTPKVAGDKMWVIFDAAASVVDSSTITCVGNTNFQAAANDIALVYALTTSTFLFIPFPNTAASWRTLTGSLAATDTPVGQHTIWVPAGAMEVAASTAPATSNVVEIGTSLFAARTMDFGAANDEFAYFGILMPKSWNAGNLVCQFIWSTTSTNTGNCIWSLTPTSLGNSDLLTTGFSAQDTVTDAGLGTADDIHISPELTISTFAGTATKEDYLTFEVSRDAAVSGDTFSGIARLHGIRIHYTTDTGSDT